MLSEQTPGGAGTEHRTAPSPCALSQNEQDTISFALMRIRIFLTDVDRNGQSKRRTDESLLRDLDQPDVDLVGGVGWL